jgi:hypothetical protein
MVKVLQYINPYPVPALSKPDTKQHSDTFIYAFFFTPIANINYLAIRVAVFAWQSLKFDKSATL